MSWADIKLLYIRELRSAMRERSIVINSILIPIFLYPAILWLIYTGISFVSGQTEGFSTRLMLKGEEALQVELKRFLDEDKRFEVKVETDALQAMSVENLDLIVELLPARDEGLAGNFQVKVFYDESKDRSKSGLDRFTEKLNEYREKFLEKRATELGITEGSFQQFTFESENVATKREMGQFVLGLILPFFIIVMLALGGFYPAIDSTAGEREKSTWETIITTAASRTEIVLAKYLYVSTMSLLAGMLNLAAMLFSMKSVLSPLFGASTDNFSFEIPFGSIPVIVVCSVLLSLFISAGMMMLASFARTFKDGQSLVSPFYV
ncbi:MAG: ABC transporter permease, partial [Blastocatellia bacterium]|nr:ABC transporter permease [Blastocatellia bacterium]